jgi:hypothetical protein
MDFLEITALSFLGVWEGKGALVPNKNKGWNAKNSARV